MLCSLFLSVAFCFGGHDQRDLVKKLGHSNFAIRNHAHVKLLRIKDPALYFQLKEIKTTDAEIIARRRLLMESLAQRWHEIKRPNYKPDLAGYPKFPWIPWDGSGYQWRSFERRQIFQKYWHHPGSARIMDQHPDYARYRKATEIWLAERIDLDLKDAIAAANSEPEIHKNMEVFMEAIRKDVIRMIEDEDRYWRNHRAENPLRKTSIKKD